MKLDIEQKDFNNCIMIGKADWGYFVDNRSEAIENIALVKTKKEAENIAKQESKKTGLKISYVG